MHYLSGAKLPFCQTKKLITLFFPKSDEPQASLISNIKIDNQNSLFYFKYSLRIKMRIKMFRKCTLKYHFDQSKSFNLSVIFLLLIDSATDNFSVITRAKLDQV